VFVKTGALENAGNELRRRGLKSPLALVTDENVGPIYAGRLLENLRQSGFSASLVTIPAGEEHKNIQTINSLWESFLKAGLERSSTVLALGGGVVTDLAGFAAATYLRGVKWAAISTTNGSLALSTARPPGATASTMQRFTRAKSSGVLMSAMPRWSPSPMFVTTATSQRSKASPSRRIPPRAGPSPNVALLDPLPPADDDATGAGDASWTARPRTPAQGRLPPLPQHRERPSGPSAAGLPDVVRTHPEHTAAPWPHGESTMNGT